MKVEIYGRNGCPYCTKAKEACEKSGVDFTYINILDPASGVTKADVQNRINALGVSHEVKTVPQIFTIDDNGKEAWVGGYDNLVAKFPWAKIYNDKK